jgi:hypothetical protein
MDEQTGAHRDDSLELDVAQVVKIRQLEETRRAAALYRSHPDPKPSEAFVAWLRKIVDEGPDLRVS